MHNIGRDSGAGRHNSPHPHTLRPARNIQCSFAPFPLVPKLLIMLFAMTATSILWFYRVPLSYLAAAEPARNRATNWVATTPGQNTSGSPGCAPLLSQQTNNFELINSQIINWTNFDPVAYRMYNSDIQLPDSRLKWHYQMIGVYEGRIYRRVPIYLQYVAGAGGLCNQLYSMISVLSLARAVGATVIVPPTHVRGSYQHQKNWSTADPESIYDLSKMAAHWRNFNVTLIKVPGHGSNNARSF